MYDDEYQLTCRIDDVGNLLLTLHTR
jgi:hypothetical protein